MSDPVVLARLSLLAAAVLIVGRSANGGRPQSPPVRVDFDTETVDEITDSFDASPVGAR